MKITAPKGTKDILPSDVYRWHKAEKTFADVCHLYGYEEIRIPTFEDTNLFQRSVGDTTDVVQKEMYTFNDKGNRSITLRPEGTAGVVRSFIENGMTSLASPVRMFYNITAFRYENVQKGRMREFHQFGLEAFGSEGPEIDAEIISILTVFFDRMGIKNTKLCINSIGCPSCRAAYNEELKNYFRPNLDKMCDDCKSRFDKNPLRMIDCKDERCQAFAKGAPRLIDYLCEDCNNHFETLKSELENLDIKYEIDSGIVRGLDYYTRTVFEFKSENVGTQGTICGGGRYDGLCESMGGASVPGIGFAMGAERFLMECEAQGIEIEKPNYVKVYLASLSDSTKSFINKTCLALRKAGVGCEQDLVGRSFKAQMKYANKANIPYVIVVGDDEITNGKVNIKNMADGVQTEVDINKIVDFFTAE